MSPVTVCTLGASVGTPIELIEAAHTAGWSVVSSNPNLNHHSSGSPIAGSDSPVAHVLTVWDWLIETLDTPRIVVAAHSQGGAIAFELVQQRQADVTQHCVAMAFADSVHTDNKKSSEPAAHFLATRVVNW